ncbi:MAG: SDR family NAD(P)-dependent oxidoreductase, partial [Polyangiaceae bacterium]|nr:SDR family NAD(P)-dependent oxidoreductase [Polyangiaceae bacterium]
MTSKASLLERFGPVALVTGAASGIGRSFASLLAREGFSLLLVDKQREGLASCRAALPLGSDCTAESIVGDLTSEAFISSLAARFAREPIGLLVHSAGISTMGRFLDLPIEALEREVDLHCRASLALVHAAGRAMRARGRGGIVLLSSNSAILRSPYVSNYAATKAYTLALAESLYEDLRHDGIDVLGLVAGMTATPLLEDAGV